LPTPLLLSTTLAPTATSTLSLHDALPICCPSPKYLVLAGKCAKTVMPKDDGPSKASEPPSCRGIPRCWAYQAESFSGSLAFRNTDRKSTRLNSSHLGISYAVFCLKKKKKT